MGGALDTSASVGEASAGKVFTVTLKGNSDVVFFEARIDRVARLIKVETLATPAPQELLTTTYAYVSLRDASGEELFSHDFIGNERVTASVYTFPLDAIGGETLYVHHAEYSTRCVITNEGTAKHLNAARDCTIKVTDTGIDVVTSPSEIGPVPTFQGNTFRLDILDDAYDKVVVSIGMDLTTNVQTFNVYPVIPTPANMYQSVVIEFHFWDASGELVHSRLLNGRASPRTSAQTYHSQKGWKLQMISYLPTYLTNTETGAVSDTRSFTFQAVARGLLSVAS
ncbi:MAG: hypothetical protein JO067_10970 [Cupriavidus sp.]|nr:hypothetical protein [Cupriavidus sp.]